MSDRSGLGYGSQAGSRANTGIPSLFDLIADANAGKFSQQEEYWKTKESSESQSLSMSSANLDHVSSRGLDVFFSSSTNSAPKDARNPAHARSHSSVTQRSQSSYSSESLRSSASPFQTGTSGSSGSPFQTGISADERSKRWEEVRKKYELETPNKRAEKQISSTDSTRERHGNFKIPKIQGQPGGKGRVRPGRDQRKQAHRDQFLSSSEANKQDSQGRNSSREVGKSSLDKWKSPMGQRIVPKRDSWKRDPPRSAGKRDNVNSGQNMRRETPGQGRNKSSLTARMYAFIDPANDNPLVGLQYIIETQHCNRSVAPKYVCNLCNLEEDNFSILGHIIGQAHRMKFLEKNYPELYERAAKISVFSKQRDWVEVDCRNIEKEHGREGISVIRIGDSFENQKNNAGMSGLVKMPPPPLAETGNAGKPKGESSAPQPFRLLSLTEFAPEFIGKPLLGLRYIVKIKHPSDPELVRFKCNLCKKEFLAKSHTIRHVMSRNHSLAFMKVIFPDMVKKELPDRNPEKPWRQALDSCIQQLHDQHGPDFLKVTTDTSTAYWDSVEQKMAKREDNSMSLKALARREHQEQQEFEEHPDLRIRKLGFALPPSQRPDSQSQSNWKKEIENLNDKMKSQSIIPCQRPSKFSTMFGNYMKHYPCIGLQWITEFQKPDKTVLPWFMCFLCERKLQWKSILSHVTSTDHRLAYMKKSFPSVYELLNKQKFQSQEYKEKTVEEFSRDIDSEDNEKTVAVMIELNYTMDQLKSFSQTKGQSHSSATATASSSVTSSRGQATPRSTGSKLQSGSQPARSSAGPSSSSPAVQQGTNKNSMQNRRMTSPGVNRNVPYQTSANASRQTAASVPAGQYPIPSLAPVPRMTPPPMMVPPPMPLASQGSSSGPTGNTLTSALLERNNEAVADILSRELLNLGNPSQPTGHTSIPGQGSSVEDYIYAVGVPDHDGFPKGPPPSLPPPLPALGKELPSADYRYPVPETRLPRSPEDIRSWLPEERRLAEPPEDRRLAAPPEDRRIDRLPEERRLAGPPEDRRLAAPPEDRRIDRLPEDRLMGYFEDTGLAGPPEGRRLAGPPEDRKIDRLPEDRRLAGPPEDRRIARSPEDRRLAGPPEDRRIARSPEDRRLAGPPEDRRIARLPEDRLAGPPEDRRIARSPEDRRLAGPPEDRRIARSPEERRLAGPPEDRRLAGPPEDRRLAGPPEDRRIDRSPEDRRLMGYFEDTGLAGLPDERRMAGYFEDPSLAVPQEDTRLPSSMPYEGQRLAMSPEWTLGEAELYRFHDSRRLSRSPEGRRLSMSPEDRGMPSMHDRRLSLSPEGQRFPGMPIGRRLSISPDRRRLSLSPDGREFPGMPIGRRLSISPERRRLSLSPEGREFPGMSIGRRLSISPDRRRLSLSPEGRGFPGMPVGRRLSISPNRRRLSQSPEGRGFPGMPVGRRLSISPDRRRLSLSPEGRRLPGMHVSRRLSRSPEDRRLSWSPEERDLFPGSRSWSRSPSPPHRRWSRSPDSGDPLSDTPEWRDEYIDLTASRPAMGPDSIDDFGQRRYDQWGDDRSEMMPAPVLQAAWMDDPGEVARYSAPVDIPESDRRAFSLVQPQPKSQPKGKSMHSKQRSAHQFKSPSELRRQEWYRARQQLKKGEKLSYATVRQILRANQMKQQAKPGLRVTKPQANQVPRVAKPQANQVSRAANPQANQVSRAAKPQAKQVSRVANPQANQVSSVAKPQANQVPRVAKPQANPVSKVTKPQEKPVSSITKKQETLVTKSQEKAPKSQTGATVTQEKQQPDSKLKQHSSQNEVNKQGKGEAVKQAVKAGDKRPVDDSVPECKVVVEFGGSLDFKTGGNTTQTKAPPVKGRGSADTKASLLSAVVSAKRDMMSPTSNKTTAAPGNKSGIQKPPVKDQAGVGTPAPQQGTMTQEKFAAISLLEAHGFKKAGSSVWSSRQGSGGDILITSGAATANTGHASHAGDKRSGSPVAAVPVKKMKDSESLQTSQPAVMQEPVKKPKLDQTAAGPRQQGPGNKPQGQGNYGNKPQGQRNYGNRQQGPGNKPQGQSDYGNKPQGQGNYGNRQQGPGNRQQGPGNKPQGQGNYGNKPQGQRNYGNKQQGQGNKQQWRGNQNQNQGRNQGKAGGGVNKSGTRQEAPKKQTPAKQQDPDTPACKVTITFG